MCKAYHAPKLGTSHAHLAGLDQGLCPKPEEFAKSWKLEKRFVPKMAAELRKQKYGGWREAMRKLLS
jgi:glycerol kinase